MKYLLPLLLLVALFQFTPAQAELPWYHSIDEAFAQAQATGKVVFVDVYTDWCSWCKKLDAETFSHADFQAISTEFVLLKVDGDKEVAFCTKYTVRAYPTMLFLKPDGTEVRRIKGFVTAATLVPIMKEVLGQTVAARQRIFQEQFTPRLPWLTDFAQAKALAQQNNCLIFVDCYTDWCSWCKKLDAETFSHPDFQAISAKFVLLKINGDTQPEFKQQYQLRYYPTMLFLNAQGVEQKRLVGFLTVDKLVPIMKEMLGQ